jgi:hypothetical protein
MVIRIQGRRQVTHTRLVVLRAIEMCLFRSLIGFANVLICLYGVRLSTCAVTLGRLRSILIVVLIPHKEDYKNRKGAITMTILC